MRIAIDAGHGLGNRASGVYDPGASANGLKEATVALGMANRLRADLEALGHKVLLIKNMPVTARDDAARKWGADFLLSLHCNAGGGTGTEALVNLVATARAKAVARATSRRLAGVLGIPDRGVKGRGLAVLAGPVPDCLLEMFFIDSKTDVRRYQQRVDTAELAILNGLLEGLGLKTVPRLPRIATATGAPAPARQFMEVRIHVDSADVDEYRALAASNNDFIKVTPTTQDSFRSW